MTGATPLTNRAVNRATLARQHLLERTSATALDEIAHLGGMQAQAPLAPYVGLWTRLRDFAPDQLSELYQQRQVVRMALMRGTIHLTTAADAIAWRPLVEPVIVRGTNSAFGRHYTGLDRDELAQAARELVEQSPRTFAELGTLLAERFPGRDGPALAQAARAHLPLVQVPPRGLWGATGRIAHTTAQHWLGRDIEQNPAPAPAAGIGAATQTDALEAMVRRYLAAFGPATIMDAQAWSGLTRLREIFDRLRPTLRVLRVQDDNNSTSIGSSTSSNGRTSAAGGAELFDLPDAPRPDPDTPAPARFLPEYDNLLFSHADRTRFNPANHTIPLFPGNGAALGYYLLDGVWSGLWRTERTRPRSKTKARSARTSAGAGAGAGAGAASDEAATETGVGTGSITTGERDEAGGTIRLTVQHFGSLTAAARDELTGEGLNLLAFLAPDAASPEIHFTPAT